MALLELNNVHAYYGKIHALKGISITVNSGEIVTLIGSNGAGKTTTLRTIAGLMQPRQGSVMFAGENVYLSKPYEIISKGISMVPEGRGIFAKMTVVENLQMGAFYRNDREAIQKDIEYAYELFPRLGERRKQLAGTMSGGEQQMLSTARALMAKPKLILMDEPSMGLAPVLVDLIFETIQRINQEGVTVLLVEQNALMSLGIAHRGYVLQTGEIVLSDDAKSLKNNPSVQKAYLGIE
jgi:branched-chain amino acid transport system ATP-binding protein